MFSLKSPAFLLLVCTLVRSLPGVEIDPVPPTIAHRVATIRIHVVPDHRDWTYQIGQPAHFKVTVTADDEPLTNVPVTYTVGQEFVPSPSKKIDVPAEGIVIDGSALQEPGFVRCSVTADVAGHTYHGAGTAAYAPQDIKPTQTEPQDFDAFWNKGKEALAAIPMDPLITLMPEACTASVNVYHVQLRNLGKSWQGSAHVYGILCEPKAPGKYPAILHVPGAGIRPYFGDIELASRGVITFEIGVHGIPVNMPKQVYDDLLSGPLNGYWLFNLEDKEKFYFYRIYLGCVRSNDFLTSRPNWDGKNLIVEGKSQGGELSIVTAALDSRVTGLAVTHPGFCDVSGELHGRAGGWPHPFRADPTTGAPSPDATPAKIETARYYDTVNFAKRIKVPGYYNWGYNDETCPPTSTFSAYNVITAPKQLDVTLELAHQYTPEQHDAINAWITKVLGLK